MELDEGKLKVGFGGMLICFWLLILEVNCHGRLMQPPARNCMWRFGYDTPKNYDDNQLWCGGAAVMNLQNDGKCGVCGDNFADKSPRAHEAGGLFATGIKVKTYAPGQDFDVEVELTANHQGTFQLKLCPVKDETIEVSQECLDSYTLKVLDADGAVGDKYVITSSERTKTFYFTAKLPQYVSCSHCVLQWTYITANTWGACANGTEAVGCGAQERFVNCADIAIIQNTGGRPPTKPQEPLNNSIIPQTTTGYRNDKPYLTAQRCIVRGAFPGNSTKNDWCQRTCLDTSTNCPPQCQCLQGCVGAGALKYHPGADVYCMDQCLVYPPTQHCTPDRCACF